MTVNELFPHGTFISYDEYHEKFTPIHENGYLVLKHHLMTIFRPSGKYGPPIINKNVQYWNIESMSKLFSSKSKDSKKFRKMIFAQKKVKNNRKAWQTTLNDFSVSNELIKKSHDFTNKKKSASKVPSQKNQITGKKNPIQQPVIKTPTSNKNHLLLL